MCKRLILSLAVILLAGTLFFPLTAYAEEDVEDATTLTVEVDSLNDTVETGADIDADTAGDSEETESGIPPYDGPKYLTPDGTATVIDNVFIEGNGLEFFTFTTEAGNVFYLVVDRARTQNNVYFLNYVTEQDLLALAEKDSKGGNTSTSGIPSTTGGTTAENPAEEPEPPEQPPAKNGNTGMLIFLLLGIAAVGGAAYYFKIVRPKKQMRDDDDGEDIEDGYGDDDAGDYFGDTDDEADPAERD